MNYTHIFDDICGCLKHSCLEVYNDRLVSLCVFGSVAAGTMRPESDIDLLVVSESLPHGRMARVREFETVDRLCEAVLKQAMRKGVMTLFSPLIKTPGEVRMGSPIFLDMTDTARILFDREHFLDGYLDDLRRRLSQLGSKRVEFRGGYYWVLKPDLKPGEEIIL